MKRVLVLTKFRPGGRPFGGLIRTARLLDALRTRFEVTVLGFEQDSPPAPRSRPSSLVNSAWRRLPYQVVRYDTPWLRRELDSCLQSWRPDAIHVDYLNQAPLVWDLDLPLALDLHNMESALSQGIAESSRGMARFMAHRDAVLLRAVEARASQAFRLITAPSAKEAGRMPGEVHVVANGVDPSREPLGVTPDPRLVCFVGIFSWLPNVDGAEWLAHEVVPLLPTDVRVQLVGRSPHRRVESLAGPRIEVTGEVPDTWPYVSNASVVLAPLLAPGGTRHKILEGLLAERPVVATPQAADGLEDLAGEGVILAADPAAFAMAIVDLLDDPVRAADLGRAGRRAVIDRYSWDRSSRRLLELYETHLGLR